MNRKKEENRKPKEMIKKKIDLDKIKIYRLNVRVERLKKVLRERERKEKKKILERQNQINQLQKENWDFSYSAIKEITNKFFRKNGTKNNEMSKIKLKQAQISIDMANRNLEINRKLYLSKKEILQNKKIESKLGLNEDNVFENLRKSLSKRKIKSSSCPPTKRKKEIEDMLNKSFIEEIKSKQEMKKGSKLFRMNKISSAKQIKVPSFNITRSRSQNRNIKTANKENNGHNSFNTSGKNKVIASSFRAVSNKVKNLPLYTTKIEDIIIEYDLIRERMEKERKKYIKNRLLSPNDIDEIMKTRTEMKILRLKNKYLKTKFPEPGTTGNKSLNIEEIKNKIGHELDKIERKFYNSRDTNKEFDFTKEDFFENILNK